MTVTPQKQAYLHVTEIHLKEIVDVTMTSLINEFKSTTFTRRVYINENDSKCQMYYYGLTTDQSLI